jgi:hypothetical protein
MKKNQWAKLREKLDKKGAALHEAEKKLQSECPHEHLTYKYEGSGGSWDNPRGEYWIQWHCQDCEKRWTTDQNIDEVNKYPNAKEIKRY